MPLALQINNTFRSRWFGAFWQDLGAKVIPTISWGDERTWDFCFDGVEEGWVVFVATYCLEYPDRFMAGYNKMLEVIKPSAVIVCGGETARHAGECEGGKSVKGCMSWVRVNKMPKNSFEIR